jgi:hypothetical protein
VASLDVLLRADVHPPLSMDLVTPPVAGSARPPAFFRKAKSVPAVRPGRRVSYNESGCGDTQHPIPAIGREVYSKTSCMSRLAGFVRISHSAPCLRWPKWRAPIDASGQYCFTVTLSQGIGPVRATAAASAGSTSMFASTIIRALPSLRSCPMRRPLALSPFF